jgi:hypothetical protein
MPILFPDKPKPIPLDNWYIVLRLNLSKALEHLDLNLAEIDLPSETSTIGSKQYVALVSTVRHI